MPKLPLWLFENRCEGSTLLQPREIVRKLFEVNQRLLFFFSAKNISAFNHLPDLSQFSGLVRRALLKGEGFLQAMHIEREYQLFNGNLLGKQNFRCVSIKMGEKRQDFWVEVTLR